MFMEFLSSIFSIIMIVILLMVIGFLQQFKIVRVFGKTIAFIFLVILFLLVSAVAIAFIAGMTGLFFLLAEYSHFPIIVNMSLIDLHMEDIIKICLLFGVSFYAIYIVSCVIYALIPLREIAYNGLTVLTAIIGNIVIYPMIINRLFPSIDFSLLRLALLHIAILFFAFFTTLQSIRRERNYANRRNSYENRRSAVGQYLYPWRTYRRRPRTNT